MKVRDHVGMFTKSSLSNDFYFSLMFGPRTSVIQQYCVVGQIVVDNKTLSVLINLYNLFSLGLFL